MHTISYSKEVKYLQICRHCFRLIKKTTIHQSLSFYFLQLSICYCIRSTLKKIYIGKSHVFICQGILLKICRNKKSYTLAIIQSLMHWIFNGITTWPASDSRRLRFLLLNMDTNQLPKLATYIEWHAATKTFYSSQIYWGYFIKIFTL